MMTVNNFSPGFAAKSLLIFLLISGATALRACDVPVFRYALERWPVETYEVTVYHRGPLARQKSEVVETLKNHSQALVPYSNFIVRDVDLELKPEPDPQVLELSPGADKPPYLVVRYPGWLKQERIIWSAALSAGSARGLIDSPLRQQIAEKILGGETAVWVLVESGDREKDDTAAGIIKKTLAGMEKKLRLPDAVTGVPPQGAPDLRIDFSLVRLSRNDPEETFLIRMLTRSEADLEQYGSWPMAFPLYGRGRLLYALVGRGITEENVSEACAFLAGPCACEIKDSNSGMDLLILADWDEETGGSWVDAVATPPLSTLASMAESSGAGEPGSGDDNSKNRLYYNIFLALALVVAVIAIVSFRLLRSGRGK